MIAIVFLEVVGHVAVHLAFKLELLGVELVAEHLLELILGDDLDLIFIGLRPLEVSHIVVVADDPEAADVAAGDLPPVLGLSAPIPLVDAHGATHDREAAVESWLPCKSIVACIAGAVVANRSQISGTARPSVHVALWLTPRVPRWLSGSAVSAIEPVTVDEEAVPRGWVWHLAHVAADTERSPRAVLMKPEGAVGVACWVSRVVAHSAVANTIEGLRPGPCRNGSDRSSW